MAITTQDQLVDALANNNTYIPVEVNSITAVANFFYLANKGGGGVGTFNNGTAFSAGGEIPTKQTSGFPNFANATGLNKNRIYNLQASSTTTSGFWTLADTLYRASGFSGTAITEQIIAPTAPSLTRGSANGSGNQIWVVIDSALGSTASNITVKYINQDDVEKTTVARAIGGTQPGNRMLRCLLADGDFGVKRIVSCTLSASTGTAGAFSIYLINPIKKLGNIVAITGISKGFTDCGLKVVDNDAALTLICLAATTATGSFELTLNVIQG